MTSILSLLREIKEQRVQVAALSASYRAANAAYQAAWRNGPTEAKGDLRDELIRARTALLDCSLKDSIVEPAGLYRVLREWNRQHDDRVQSLLVARDALYRDLSKAETALYALDLALALAIDEADTITVPGEDELREAHRVALQRYLGMIRGLTDAGAVSVWNDQNGSYEHLSWMCQTMLDVVLTDPIDKISRWMSFVQAVLCVNGVTSVQAERDVTRALFHAAYAAAGRPVPPTRDRPSA